MKILLLVAILFQGVTARAYWLMTNGTAASATAPAIAGNPTNAVGVTNTALVLTVTATGTSPLNYQWHLGTLLTNVIASATNASYTNTSATAQTNSYLCLITNAAGSVTSSVATMAWTNGTGSFTPSGVAFNGTDGYLNRGGNLTGVSNSSIYSMSLWIKLSGGNGAAMTFFRDSAINLKLFRNTDNKFYSQGANMDGISPWISSATYSSESSWHHVCMSRSGATVQWYIDESSDTRSAQGNTTLDSFGSDTEWTIGRHPSSLQYLNGSIAELYLTLEYIDWSNSANCAKFASGGHPVDLGATGATPTGNQPIIYLSGGTNTFYINKGYGGNFILNGGLSTDTSGP